MTKAALEEHGIETIIHNLNLEHPEMAVGVRVRIKDKDLPQALAIVEQIEKEWEDYDHLTRQILGTDTRDLLNTSADELIARHADTPDGMEKLELAAVNMLKLAEEVDEDNPLLKSRLRQEGIQLLKYIQQHSDNYSLQREFLIGLLETNH